MHMSIFVSKCVSIHMLHIFSIEKVHNTEATQSFFQEYKVLGAVWGKVQGRKVRFILDFHTPK